MFIQNWWQKCAANFIDKRNVKFYENKLIGTK